MDADFSAALRAALVSLAGARRTITYRDLAARVPVPPPHGIHKLTLALEGLVRDDHAAGRPLLAALAVRQTAAGIPGRGFFHLLAELGRYAGPDRGPAAATAHAAELAHAFAYWGAGAGAAQDGPGDGAAGGREGEIRGAGGGKRAGVTFSARPPRCRTSSVPRGAGRRSGRCRAR